MITRFLLCGGASLRYGARYGANQLKTLHPVQTPDGPAPLIVAKLREILSIAGPDDRIFVAAYGEAAQLIGKENKDARCELVRMTGATASPLTTLSFVTRRLDLAPHPEAVVYDVDVLYRAAAFVERARADVGPKSVVGVVQIAEWNTARGFTRVFTSNETGIAQLVHPGRTTTSLLAGAYTFPMTTTTRDLLRTGWDGTLLDLMVADRTPIRCVAVPSSYVNLLPELE